MFQHFCTRVARKLRRLGYARKTAARLAKFFYVTMITLCGLFGLFFDIPEELYEPMPGAGVEREGSRPGSFLPATFIKRR
jgi:hypothetical protein